MADTREWRVEKYRDISTRFNSYGYAQPDVPIWAWVDVRQEYRREFTVEKEPMTLDLSIQWLRCFTASGAKFNSPYKQRFRLFNINTEVAISPEMLGIPT